MVDDIRGVCTGRRVYITDNAHAYMCVCVTDDVCVCRTTYVCVSDDVWWTTCVVSDDVRVFT